MRLRIILLAASAIATALSGRICAWFEVVLIAPPGIIPGLIFVLFSLIVLVPRSGDESFWNRSLTRYVSLAICWGCLLARYGLSDGLSELGR